MLKIELMILVKKLAINKAKTADLKKFMYNIEIYLKNLNPKFFYINGINNVNKILFFLVIFLFEFKNCYFNAICSL
jgi:hypothetical protein